MYTAVQPPWNCCRTITEILAFRWLLSHSDFTTFNFDCGFSGGAYDAPPDPLVGWGEGYPSHSYPSTPPAPRSGHRRWPLNSISGYAPVLGHV